MCYREIQRFRLFCKRSIKQSHLNKQRICKIISNKGFNDEEIKQLEEYMKKEQEKETAITLGDLFKDILK